MSESERTLSLYEILGIPSSSPISAIRHAYYQLCLTLHPDRCSPSTFNPTQFQRVQHAWEILRDPTTRQQYDTTLGIHNSSSYSFEHLTIDDLCESASSASGDTYFARCRCGGNVSIRITDVDQVFECTGCSLKYRIDI
jgi:DnaJ-class molecular chaperone